MVATTADGEWTITPPAKTGMKDRNIECRHLASSRWGLDERCPPVPGSNCLGWDEARFGGSRNDAKAPAPTGAFVSLPSSAQHIPSPLLPRAPSTSRATRGMMLTAQPRPHARISTDSDARSHWRALARRGGYPTPAHELDAAEARSAWFAGYVRTYLERDLLEISAVASLVDVRRLMRAICLRLGGLLNQTEVARDIGMSQPTVHRHLNLLETTYQLVRLPAFTVNRTKRLLKTPRGFWCDTGLAMHLAGETTPQGAHLESLVLQDLLAWRDSSPMEAEILYWRTVAGDEVDFVIEQDGMLLPIEVKTGRRPSLADVRSLKLFRQEYADRARPGLLLHTGSEIAWLADGVLAAPWWRVF
jgi:predicted AAA+ superfamily ATPase